MKISKTPKCKVKDPGLGDSWWNRIRALIIDDEEPVRTMIRDILETQGYVVDDAPDGAVGMDKFRAMPTDLVITDIIMSQKGGFEIIWAIRKEFPDVKIIAISGGGAIGKKDVLKSAKKMGAHGCLQKPFKAEELIEMLETLGF